MRLHFCARFRPAVLALILALASAAPLRANDKDKGRARLGEQTQQLRVVELKHRDGQILSYRHLAGSTDVVMRGTALSPQAQIKLKIGSRPGFVELDINRGGISGLTPAYRLGRDFLTYVLWAVSVDGRASNLGEITFDGDHAVPVNVTTPYQTFWLMVTAEPNFAVVDPSEQIVLYSVAQASTSENKAQPINSPLFYFTHYTTYETVGQDTVAAVPNQLLQARKAVELASRSSVFAAGTQIKGLREPGFTRDALQQATTFLEKAEKAYVRDAKSQEVVQFARTAAQSAENARALAMGAVGGLMIRQLEDEVDRLKAELDRLRPSTSPASGAGVGSAPSRGTPPTALPVATVPPMPAVAVPLVKQPALWFAIAGWVLAVVVLFRRRTV